MDIIILAEKWRSGSVKRERLEGFSDSTERPRRKIWEDGLRMVVIFWNYEVHGAFSKAI